MPKIAELRVDRFTLPLPEPIEAYAAGVMRAFDMVAVRITDADGTEGVGYTVMHEGQGASIVAVADGPFRNAIMGEDADRIEWLWRRMYRRVHYAGRGGPVSFALAAVDVALHDLRGRRLGQPLWRLLGGYDPKVRAYAGNIDLNFPLEKLLEGASRSVEEGFRSVKMRLGRPTLSEDIARVEAMRAHLPPEIEMMADANEAWRVDEAVRAMQRLRPFDLVWLEEPIAPDNLDGYAYLRRLGLVPLAAGENLHTVAEFTALIAAGGVDFSRAGPDHLRRHHALHEGCPPGGGAWASGHQPRCPRSARAPSRRLPEQRVPRMARLRARSVHGRAADRARRVCLSTRAPRARHHLRLGELSAQQAA